MQKRHGNRQQYFDEQSYTTGKYVLPYIREVKEVHKDSRVLEIGCADCGNMVPFIELGCEVVANDISPSLIELAKELIKHKFSPKKTNITFVADDIYNVKPNQLGKFDIIVMRDVIEHIHRQDKFMDFVKQFLKPDGIIFLGFPPWNMPFGGHQQVCKHKWLSKVPYYHLLPMSIYRFVLNYFGEKTQDFMEIRKTSLSIRKFNKILKNCNYVVRKKTYYLINPNYEIKFSLKPRKVLFPFSRLSYIRDFYTTCCYYVVSMKN